VASINFEMAKKFEGWVSEPVIYTVEKGAVRKFVEAIGDANPLYTDEEFARHSVFGRLIAPPTFPIIFNHQGQRPEINGFQGSRLNGEQEFIYKRPLYIGERVRVITRLANVEEKQGKDASLTILHYVSEGKNEEEELIYTVRATTIIRLSQKQGIESSQGNGT
jgi:acyl dehydratase